MDGRGLTNKYDHVILAGASLGALVIKPGMGRHLLEPCGSGETNSIISQGDDHRPSLDRGAYKVFIGPETAKDRETETRYHTEQLRKLGSMLTARYPESGVELLLMSLDGTVEPITPTA